MARKKQNDDDRCVLTLPLHTEPWQEQIIEKRFKIMEHLQNSLIALEKRKLKNLQHTKAYRSLMEQIAEAPPEQKKALYKQRREMLQKAGFNEYAFKDDMTPMQKHFVEHIYSQVGHKTASRVWRAFEAYLYGSGHEVHFKRRDSLNSVANEHNGNGMSYADNMFTWNGGRSPHSQKLCIPVEPPRTAYEQAMLEKEIANLCVLRKWMKTRYKYYLQVVLKGRAVSKHPPAASGRVGLDLGTQTLAIAAASQVRLLVLADRVQINHSKALHIQRAMDASRRATNPQNYNADGTVKRGVKLQWQKSRRYLRLQGQLREYQRKNTDIRTYQHNCLANYILSLGSEIYLEKMNIQGLQRRAKQTTVNAQGRYNKKKRFGKSIANRAPAMLKTILDNKLKAQGLAGIHEVNTQSFRASQLDHTNQQYVKKHLNQRSQYLSNGDHLQRDLYSAFLLMNAAVDLDNPDSALCAASYPRFKQLHDQEITRLLNENTKHPRSFGLKDFRANPK